MTKLPSLAVVQRVGEDARQLERINIRLVSRRTNLICSGSGVTYPKLVDDVRADGQRMRDLPVP
jgi:hypothetical protein